jgi:hypothetical protein
MGEPVLGVTVGGDMSLKCGDGTAGDPNAFIVFTNFPTPLATNIVGLTAEEFAPCVVQLVTEALAAGAIIGDADWLNLLTTLVNAGARIDWYKSANGVAPTAAAITGAPVSVYPSLYGGML